MRVYKRKNCNYVVVDCLDQAQGRVLKNECGENFFANYGCTFIDVGKITIGDNALLGPNVQIFSVNHPLDVDDRKAGYEYPADVTIGDNFWAGGGAIIVPGVTLGDNVIIAAGAVVTKSFGDNVLIGGNPARVIKNLK